MAQKLGETIPASLAGKEIKKYVNFTPSTLDRLPKAMPGKRYYVFDKSLPKLRCYVTDRGNKSLCVMLTVHGKTVRFPAVPIGSSSWPEIDIDQARDYAVKLMRMDDYELAQLRKKETRGRAVTTPKISPINPVHIKSVEALTDDEKRLLSTEQIMQLYLNERRGKVSPATVAMYSQTLPHHFPELYRLPFSELLDRKLLLQTLQEGGKAVQVSIQHINMLYNWATVNLLDNDYQPIFSQPNVAHQLMKTKLKSMKYEPRKTSMVPKDSRKWFDVVESMENPVDTDYMLFLFLTGMRSGDTSSRLRWQNLDFDKGLFTLRTKGKTDEVAFPLPAYVAQRLRSRASQALPDDLVFAGFTPARKHKILNQIEKALGKRVTNHDLRRTFAQVAKATNIPEMTIKQLMNHETSTDVTNKHYINNDANIEAWRDGSENNPMQEASEKVVSKILAFAGRDKEKANVVTLIK